MDALRRTNKGQADQKGTKLKHTPSLPAVAYTNSDGYTGYEETLGAAPHVPKSPRSPDIPKRGTFKRKFATPLGRVAEMDPLDKMLLTKEKDKHIDRAHSRRRQYKRKGLFPDEIYPQSGRWTYQRSEESRVFLSSDYFVEEIFIFPASGGLRHLEDALIIFERIFEDFRPRMTSICKEYYDELHDLIVTYYDIEDMYEADEGFTTDDDTALGHCLLLRKTIGDNTRILYELCVSLATIETQPRRTTTPVPFTEGSYEPQMWSGVPMNVSIDDTTADLLSQLGKDISSATESITAAANGNIKIGLDAQTSDLFEQISIDVCSAAKNISSAVSGGSTINLAPSSGFLDNLNKMGNIATDLVVLCFVIAIICVWKPKTTREKAALVAMIGVYFMAKGSLPDILKSAGFMSWANTPVLETVGPEAFAFEDLTTVISGLLSSYMVAKSGREMFKPAELAKVVSICGRMKMGVKSITDALNIIMMYVHSSIDSWYTGNPFYVQSGSGFVDEFILEAKQIMKLFDEKKLFNMQSSFDRVNAAVTIGENIGIKIPGNADNAGLRKHIYDLVNELKKVKKSLSESNFMFTGARQEPVAVMLRGPAGAGKSQAMMHLSNALNALTLKAEDFKNYEESPGTFTFNRMAETIHWDGYLQTHNVVYIDDMLQAREMQGNPECESMMVIRMVNIFENKLHMAALEGKGNTNFRSKFILANTNLRNFEEVMQAVTHPEAFMRRWDVIVDVIPKAEFCTKPNEYDPWNRVVDPSKLPKYTENTPGYDETKSHLLGSSIITPDICDYHIQRHVRGGLKVIDTGVVVDFKDLVFKIREIYVNKCNWNETFQEGLSQTIKSYRKVYDCENMEEEEQEPQFDFTSDTEIEPEINHTDHLPDQVLHVASDTTVRFMLSPMWEARIQNVSHHHTGNFLFIDNIMPLIWRQTVLADISFDGNQVVSLIFSELERVGYNLLESECKPIAINRDEFVDHIMAQLIGRDHPYISRKIWDRLYADSENFVFTLRNTITAPSWALAIRDAYKASYAWVYSLGARALNFWSSVMVDGQGSFFTSIAVSFASGVMAFGLIDLVCKMFTGEPYMDFLNGMIIGKRNESQSGVRSERLRRARVVRPRGVQPQSSIFKNPNSNLAQIMKTIRTHNCFEVWMPMPKEQRKGTETHYRPGFSLGVRGRTMMLPYHFLSALDSDLEAGVISSSDLVYFTRAGHTYKAIELTVEEVLTALLNIEEAMEEDIAFLALPKQVNAFKSIVSYFAPERFHDTYTKVRIAIMIPREDYIVETTVAKQVEKVPVGGGKTNWEPFTIGHAYQYDSCTDKGDCGSPSFVQDNSTGHPLIAMHAAGGGNTGFGTRLSQEKILAWLKIVDDVRGHFFAEELYPLEVVPSDEPVRPNVVLHGKISPDSAAPRAALASRIVRSPLHGLLGPVEKFPARLGPFYDDEGTLIKPMEKALSRYCEEDKHIPSELIQIAIESLRDSLEYNSKFFVKREVLDYVTAVTGDNSGIFAGIPRGTSAGFPDCMKPGGSTKARFWGSTEIYDLENPLATELEDTVAIVLSFARQGIRVRHYFLDFLKDERLKISKVEAGETRLISASPTPLLIAFRMYFGSFIKWCVANKIANGFAIGINEYSEDWNLLARLLLQFGGAGIGAGDHKGFDTKHKNSTSWAILYLINDWYDDGEENRLIRETLWLEIVNSYHINLGRIFEWSCPLPSGSPPTTMFNCMQNALNFRICSYMLISPTFDFNKYVYACFLGDDNVFSVHADYQYLFNEVTLQQAMLKIGYVYTPEDKDLKEFGGPRDITEVSFLKRKFRKHEKTGTYMAPLEMLSIIDMLNWTKKSANILGDVENNINTALEELTLHGRLIFEEKKKLIMEAIDASGVIERPLNTNFDFLFARVNNRDSGYTLSTALFPDYDVALYKNPERLTAQEGDGRLKQEGGGLFSLTPRMPQSSNPGPSGRTQRVTRLVSYNGVASTPNSVTRTLNAETAPGHTDQGTFETVRIAPVSAQDSGTTREEVDAETPHTQIAKYVPLSPSVLDQARLGNATDVKSFLAKPQSVAAGNLTAANTYASFIWSALIPQSLLYNYEVWKQKVQGNFAFRGTLVLTVTVNATRFQQGRYMLCWSPSGGGNNALKWHLMHAATLCQATQLPHVEIDIACDTEATLRIPHITAQGWAALDFPGGSTYGNNGYVFFTAYSPLQVATGSATCGFSILAHWEDVELALPIAPQMDVRSTGRVKRRVRNADIEQDSHGLGPISGALQKVSTTSSMLSGIPLLSSIAAPVSWATNILSQVASVWGYSKPHNSSTSTMVTRYIMSRFTNSDTSDSSTKLGFMDSNEVEDLPGFAGTDIDEMALSYVGSISAYYRTLTWSNLGGASDTLLVTSIGPRNFYSTTLINGVIHSHLTPVTFLSSLFGLYRGSIKLTFKLVKTEFHSGRLMVMFYPRDDSINAAYPNTTYSQTAYCLREIIDVRNGNEFSFLLPYSSLTAYRSTAGLDDDYGQLIITILNPLVAPAVVPSSIYIYMEAAAGPDFEWAQPVDIAGSVVQTYVPQMSRSNVCSIVDGVVGGATVHIDSQASRMCIGEKVLSLQTLTKRFTQLCYRSGGEFVMNKYLNITPFMNWCGYAEGAVTSTPLLHDDALNIISSCYALARGGVRLKVVNMDVNATVNPVVASVPTTGGTFDPAFVNYSFTATPSTTICATYPYRPHRPAAVFRADANGGVEAEYPYYNRTHSTAVCDTFAAGPVGNSIRPDWKGPVPRVASYVYYSVVPTTPALVYRAASEDHHLGLFMSVPPLVGYDANYVG